MKYVFGPLRSRRLGNSLGINLMPAKTCSFDCIYCQLGRTVKKTVKSIKFADSKRLFQELKFALKDKNIDYVTFAGLGEPTLISNLRTIIKKIKGLTHIPVAVITNSSLLMNKQVVKALLCADVILPSLDAVEEKTFQRINHPHPSVKLNNIINGLFDFRKKFNGKIWLEIMLIKQIAITSEHLDKFKEIIKKIKPDKIHLTNPVRVRNKNIRPKSRKRLLEIKRVLGDNCYIV